MIKQPCQHVSRNVLIRLQYNPVDTVKPISLAFARQAAGAGIDL
jgi:hypothetical protein